MKKNMISILILIFVIALTACGSGNKEQASQAPSEQASKEAASATPAPESKPEPKGKIVISGKQFTEQVILAHMLSELIRENTNIDVVTKANLGPTDVLMQGMKDGDIDMFTEYTGTGYMVVLKQTLDTRDPQVIYDRTKKGYEEQLGITWLTPFHFNNTYAIAIREDKAQELGIKTISDLAKHAPDFVLGTEYDFLEREDGIVNFNKTYGIKWKEAKGMDRGLTYNAVKDGQVDAIVAFATDGRIPRFNLRVLEDDKQYFPPYYGAPIIKTEVLQKYPEIKDLFDKLAPLLTDATMADLNSKVDIDGQKDETVAHDFLVKNGLVKGQ